MNPSTTVDQATVTIPITLRAREIADRFRQEHPHKAKQVYLNTLAVQVVQAYLSWFGIATELSESYSWNPVMQALSNVADLMVTGVGRLECRSVLPNEVTCQIPAEVWGDRIGYVAVQFDQALTEAVLLGFTAQVTTETVSIAQLRSLDELLDRLKQSEPEAPTHLSRWLEGTIEAGWQTLEECFGQQPILNFRGTSQLQAVESPVIRSKMLNLGIGLEEIFVALLVGVIPTDTEWMEVWIRVCPLDRQTYLPAGLEVIVLDAEDCAAMQAQSRHTDMIQLRFTGTIGETFSIKIALGRQSVIKAFVI
ncbi:DUF1822 family protein [Phormidesmis sp. 146-33]